MKYIEHRFIHDGQELVGIILQRDDFYYNVRLIHPYKYMPVSGSITGIVKAHKSYMDDDFFYPLMESNLTKAYGMAKTLSKSLERLAKQYGSHIKENIILESLKSTNSTESIKTKIENQFFINIFVSKVSGLYPSIFETSYILGILDEEWLKNSNRNKGLSDDIQVFNREFRFQCYFNTFLNYIWKPFLR